MALFLRRHWIYFGAGAVALLMATLAWPAVEHKLFLDPAKESRSTQAWNRLQARQAAHNTQVAWQESSVVSQRLEQWSLQIGHCIGDRPSNPNTPLSQALNVMAQDPRWKYKRFIPPEELDMMLQSLERYCATQALENIAEDEPLSASLLAQEAKDAGYDVGDDYTQGQSFLDTQEDTLMAGEAKDEPGIPL